MNRALAKRSVTRELILKDWRLYRSQIAFTLAAGAIALCVVARGTEVTVVVGTVFFFIALILVGTMLPLGGIFGERKNHNLAFMMSLPISGVQYARAKLVSSLGMFLIPWLAMVAAALLFIEVRGMFPKGIIPMTMILLLMPFIGFAILTATALIAESEGWTMLANIVVQSSYGLTWFFVSRIEGLAAHAKDAQPVWNSTALDAVGIEVAIVVALLGLALVVQSRKRDFV
jgi:ABC-2 type transport system permease protein